MKTVLRSWGFVNGRCSSSGSGRRSLGLLLMLAGMLTPIAPQATAQERPASGEDTRPNIVLVLCDDLGYGDVGCFGNDVVETPHLDRLASEGLRLTGCYSAAPNCSPARAGLMTGRTPYRAGIHNWIPMFSPMHLREQEATVAAQLRQAGYATCHVGKWHLNGQFNHPDQPQASVHGFDHWFGTQNNALPNHRNPDNFVRNGIPVGRLEGYSADIVVDEAIRWLRARDGDDRPFFLYVCFHEPHEPIATDPRYADRYDQFEDPAQRSHHGNITQMDSAMGRLLETVDGLGLRDSTLVWFTSDNGPAITGRHPYGSAGPFRDKKGSLYEGGIRVPGIVRWPGVIEAGSATDVPVSGVDALPTLCRLGGAELPPRHLDGIDISPLFRGESLRRETPLYWQFQFVRGGGPHVAIRHGNWKLLAHVDRPLPPGGDILGEHQLAIQRATLSGFELYDLRDDPGETEDLAADVATPVLDELKALMEQMFVSVQQDSPQWPAWEWPRYESQRIEWER